MMRDGAAPVSPFSDMQFEGGRKLLPTHSIYHVTMKSHLWPALPLAAWQATYDTLHMWTQIVGKVALATTPLSNHFWNIAFRLTSRGFETQPMVLHGHTFTAAFDLVSHELTFTCSDGRRAAIPLQSRTVANFYSAVMRTLHGMDADIHIWTMPVEFPNPIRFEEDTTHHSYDPDCANAYWRAVTSMQPVFEEFRCRFVGKCSPLHFFWGSFDLAVTRFSGRRAPVKPGADAIMRESYSHEVISHGFWPGGGAVKEAAFYAYAAPQPEGFPDARVEPAAAFYSAELGEFILPYDAVRTSSSPEAALMSFLDSTYRHAADLAKWDRPALER
jgi:Family of unknown function (DUF5996)